MKKLFFAGLVLALLLAGCGAKPCEHEWTQADCVNGSVCTKCEEPGEPALGHDFAAATCTTAEICTRCGEIQGQPLDHSFGDWAFEEEEMVRTCTGCSAEERKEADWEAYLHQNLPGHWDFHSQLVDGTLYGIDDMRYMAVGFYATMFEDGTCRIYTGARLFENVKWTFSEHKFHQQDGHMFFLNLDFQEGLQAVMAMQVKEGKQNLVFFFNNANFVLMEKHSQVAEALTGFWTGTQDGKLYTMELKEDRTLTGDLNGPVTGTWHLEPMQVSESGYRSMNVNIHYTQDNQPHGMMTTLSLGQDTEPLEAYLDSISLTMWQLNNIRFEKTAAASVQDTQAMLDWGPQAIIGTWTSESLDVYEKGASEQTALETTDYSLTFAEDGTVTAQFDKPYTGTWKFDKLDLREDFVAYYDYPAYVYQIQLEGMERPGEVQMLHHGRIYMGAASESHSISSWFNRTGDNGEDHAALAPDLIVGQWDAVEMVQHTDQGTEVQVPEPGTYTLTVNADGTFTADFGGPTAGQWNYSEYDFNSGYNFSFLYEGHDGSMMYSTHTPGQLRAFYEIDGIQYGFTMRRQ